LDRHDLARTPGAHGHPHRRGPTTQRAAEVSGAPREI
jgi:hypothetical protein